MSIQLDDKQDTSILLPEYMTDGRTAEQFIQRTSRISKFSKIVLERQSIPVTKNELRKLVLVKGCDMKDKPYLSEIRSYLKINNWKDTSPEDIFYLPNLISLSFMRLHNLRWVILVHQPVRHKNIINLFGLELYNQDLVVITRDANPNDQWFARDGAFIYEIP